MLKMRSLSVALIPVLGAGMRPMHIQQEAQHIQKPSCWSLLLPIAL